MAHLPETITLTSAVYRDERRVTIAIRNIEAVFDEDNGGAAIATTGGHTFRVRESYEEVWALYERA